MTSYSYGDIKYKYKDVEFKLAGIEYTHKGQSLHFVSYDIITDTNNEKRTLNADEALRDFEMFLKALEHAEKSNDVQKLTDFLDSIILRTSLRSDFHNLNIRKLAYSDILNIVKIKIKCDNEEFDADVNWLGFVFMFANLNFVINLVKTIYYDISLFDLYIILFHYKTHWIYWMYKKPESAFREFVQNVIFIYKNYVSKLQDNTMSYDHNLRLYWEVIAFIEQYFKKFSDDARKIFFIIVLDGYFSGARLLHKYFENIYDVVKMLYNYFVPSIYSHEEFSDIFIQRLINLYYDNSANLEAKTRFKFFNIVTLYRYKKKIDLKLEQFLENIKTKKPDKTTKNLCYTYLQAPIITDYSLMMRYIFNTGTFDEDNDLPMLYEKGYHNPNINLFDEEQKQITIEEIAKKSENFLVYLVIPNILYVCGNAKKNAEMIRDKKIIMQMARIIV